MKEGLRTKEITPQSVAEKIGDSFRKSMKAGLPPFDNVDITFDALADLAVKNIVKEVKDEMQRLPKDLSDKPELTTKAILRYHRLNPADIAHLVIKNPDILRNYEETDLFDLLDGSIDIFFINKLKEKKVRERKQIYGIPSSEPPQINQEQENALNAYFGTLRTLQLQMREHVLAKQQ